MSKSKPSKSAPKQADAKPKPRKKWRRRALWVLVILPLMLVATVLIIGQTAVMKSIVEPILASQLGVNVSSKSIQLMPNGQIVINDAICRTEDISSKAGALIEFEQATISMNWWGVVRGTGQVRSIVIDKPVVRASQDIDTGVINLAAMKFKSGGGGGATPAMELTNGVLEIGEHDDVRYTVLKELSINGQLSEQTSDGVSAFVFEALPAEPGMGGVGSGDGLRDSIAGSFSLTGQISEDGIDGVLAGVKLEDWPANIVPSRSRGMYQRLALAGDLAPTRFHVSNDGLVEVVLTLEGVEMNLPFDVSGSVSGEIEGGELLRMRQTRGVIRFGTSGLSAELKGVLDGLEYDVDLDFRGLDESSPFDATLVTDFRLDENFKPARFLPDNVISKLDRFENPTADVHAVVTVSRSDKADAPIAVSGRAQLSNGSAIYKKFRYLFEDMSGVIEFDPNKLVVKDIVGTSRTGARLVANGLFSPLGEDSNVRLDLSVDAVPFDEMLLAALSDKQRSLVDTLFSKEDYNRLLDEGMVLTNDEAQQLGEIRRQTWDLRDAIPEDGDESQQAQRAALTRELAQIDRALLAPAFDFGGDAHVDVVLIRHPERPSDDRWTTDVHVHLDEAGIVPKHFPIPVIARDVEIVVNDEGVELAGGRYEGLNGGSATVEVAIERTEADDQPRIKILATEFPIDERLLSAIPGYESGADDDPDALSMRRVLDRLRLGGTIDCQAIIGPRSTGKLGYDVEASIVNGIARPMRLTGVDEHLDAQALGTDPLTLDDLFGTVYVTEDLVVVDLDAKLSSPTQPIAPTRINVLTQLTLPTKEELIGAFGPPIPGPRLFATATADGIDLAMPLQHAIAVVSPRIARDLLSKNELYQTQGVLGMDALIEGYIGGATETTLSINQIQQFEFDFDEAHYRIGSSWGRAQVVLSERPSFAFDGFRVAIEADDDDAGVLSLDGLLPMGRGGRYIELFEPSTLTVHFEGGTFESPITQGVIARLTSGDINSDDDASEQAQASDLTSAQASWFDEHTIGGRFDLGVELSPQLGMHKISGSENAIAPVPTLIHGQLSPKSFRIEMGDQFASFDQVSGQLNFNGFDGTIDQIRASDGETALDLDGQWAMTPGQGLGVSVRANAHGDLLNGPVRVLLPDAVDRVIDQLEIKAPNDVQIEGLSINASGLGTARSVYDIVGGAAISEGSAVIGLPITGIVGELGFAVHGASDAIGYEITLDAQRLRAGRMRMHDAQVTIIGDADNAGVVLIPEISARMHGGQLAGSAQIRPGDNETSSYWMELHASGVRAAPVFDDLLLPPEGLEGPPIPGQTAVLSAWSMGEDLSRGAMIGDLTLTGTIGEPSKLSGRGLVRVAGGSVVALPGFLNLIEASNLSLPAGSPLDSAQADFYIDGPTIAFEELSASSKRIEILGYGTMNWSTLAIDLRFKSRSVNPIPVVSDLIERLRDELITTRVTGTVGDMNYSVRQFESTKRLINAMLGRPETDHQRRLREVEEQVRTNKIHSKAKHENTDDRVILPTPPNGQSSWDLARPAKNRNNPPTNPPTQEQTNQDKTREE